MEDAIPQGMPGGLQTGHEQTEVGPRPLVIGAAVLVVTVIICQVGLGLWMRGFERREERANALHPTRQAIEIGQFPQPRLQESPPVETLAILREERARISSYGWVDQRAGIARIPVDRAMDIIAGRGLPRVAARPSAPGTPPNTTIPPARKREEAGPEEAQPPSQKKDEKPAAAQKKEEQTRPESKQGGKP